MGKCVKCGKKGLFLKVDKGGYCEACRSAYDRARAEAAKIKTEKIKITGMSHYENDIKRLCEHNDDYDMTKAELRDAFEGERVYALMFDAVIKLVPEPDNEFDKNAIMVEADGVKIGYVPKGKTKRVRELLDSGTVTSIDADVKGGKYKLVTEGNELIKDEDSFYGEIIIKYKPNA